jgi:ABC-type dipeptide/oligopeptide/nickel transport system permease subunit
VIVQGTDGHVTLRHLLPNALSPMIVQATVTVAYAILAKAGFNFLGDGLRDLLDPKGR